VVQRMADATGKELSASAILEAFEREYLSAGRLRWWISLWTTRARARAWYARV